MNILYAYDYLYMLYSVENKKPYLTLPYLQESKRMNKITNTVMSYPSYILVKHYFMAHAYA